MAKELRSILITLLMIGLFVVLFNSFTGDVYQGYENVDNVSYIGTSQETMEDINEMQESLQNTDSSVLGTTWYYITAPFRIALMLFNSINIISSLTNDVAIILHVPVIVVDTIVGIAVVIVLFGIIKIAQRTQGGGY